ncbi:MAG: Cof-type HAD-IIB family hydrolase [Tissierellaceae bacterium]
MKYKIIAIDMDGTLLNSVNMVTERTKEAIERARSLGVHVVLSTGRMLKSAQSYALSLNLNNHIIACNGAILVDENSKPIFKRSIDRKLVKEVVDMARERDVYYHFYDESKFYSHTKVDEVFKFYNEGNGMSNIDMHIFDNIGELVASEDLNVYKFLFIDEDKDKLRGLRQELDKLSGLGTSSSWPNNIEAMVSNVSKGHALRELSQILGVGAEEIMAIGDSENDMSMFEFAGLRVSMGNGENILKEISDYITDSNDNDGVAKAIERFVLG